MHTMPPTILIIDDDAALRCLAALVLGLLGTVHQLGDGSQALETVRRLQPRLVLLDITLGGELSGLDICHLLRAQADAATRKVVLISGHGERADIALGLAAGADAYLPKPFTPDTLLALASDLMSA